VSTSIQISLEFSEVLINVIDIKTSSCQEFMHADVMLHVTPCILDRNRLDHAYLLGSLTTFTQIMFNAYNTNW
jgi:hypothetical protein